jgi:hypothetical protein
MFQSDDNGSDEDFVPQTKIRGKRTRKKPAKLKSAFAGMFLIMDTKNFIGLQIFMFFKLAAYSRIHCQRW